MGKHWRKVKFNEELFLLKIILRLTKELLFVMVMKHIINLKERDEEIAVAGCYVHLLRKFRESVKPAGEKQLKNTENNL